MKPSRRTFLKSAVAAGAVLGRATTAAVEAGDAATSPAPAKLPPHRALEPAGVHLYLARPSFRAGETVKCFASASVPCVLEMVRLGDEPDDPRHDVVLHAHQIDRPSIQPVHPGSYVHVENGLPATPHAALTLECWVRLWNLSVPQGIVTQLDDGEGFGLMVFPDGTPALFTGECDDPPATTHRADAKLTLPGGPTFSSFITPPAGWHHLVGVVGNGRKTLWLDGRRVGSWDWKQPVTPGRCPLRIGAWGRGGRADGLLDADVAMPVVYSRELSEVEIRTRYAERGLKPPAAEADLLGCWPLDEERGDVAADGSGAGRPGRIVNHATWMIGGPSFLPAVARYRRDYVPADDATRGHGLRLAADDLYDCRWRPTFTFTLPADSPSGLYAVRGRFDVAGEPRTTHAVFVVRRAAEAPPRPVALLFATNTWKAYSGAPFGPAWPDTFANVGNKGYQPKPEDPLAAYCFYRFHRAGQPTYQLGQRMPWPAASPYALASAPEVGYGHLSRADRFTQLWLSQNGYAFDALSDLDLHCEPQALAGAKVLFIVGHSEYWSREAMQRVREFLDDGGSVVCLSGNTMYWRVTHGGDDDAILECRKADAWGAQLADYMRGECWHEHDRRRGGVPRDCGDPAWRTLGVEFAGATSMTDETAGALHVVDAEHPFFHRPHETDLHDGDRFGFDRRRAARQPLGHETDVRITTLTDYTNRMPPLTGLPADLVEPSGVALLAVGRWQNDGRRGSLRDYAHRVMPPSVRRADDSICDVIYWRRPGGGQVFAVPSIAAGWTLAACPQWSAVLKNVLHAFGVNQPS